MRSAKSEIRNRNWTKSGCQTIEVGSKLWRGGVRKQGSWKPIALLHSKFSLLLVKGLYYSPLLGGCIKCHGKVSTMRKRFTVHWKNVWLASCLFSALWLQCEYLLRTHTHSRTDGDLLVWVTMKCSHNAAHLYWYGLVLSVFSVFCFLFSTSGPATQIDASLRRYVMACKAPSDKGYFSRSLDL